MMYFENLQSLLGTRNAGGSAENAAFEGLLSAEEFRAVLHRERARADRSGDQFSLLIFSASGSSGAGPALAQAAAILKKRLRSTDASGWMEGGRIGVILPSTPPEGAGTLAGDVLSQYPDGVPQPEHQVYCYPETRLSAEEKPRFEHAHHDNGQSPSSGAPAYALDSLLQERTPVWKRAIDVVVAAVSLVVLSPFLLIVAAAVKFTSSGPVIFKQARRGRGGTPFVIYKFRSMVDGAERSRQALARLNEQDGPTFKIQADPRVTPVGRFLRATSIDELPQLWNVLRGDMSLVGPRPLPCNESDACQPWHRRRLDVIPGLTGIWQTSDRRRVSFNEWMRMDVRYMQSRSPWQDVKLILATVAVVCRGKRW